MQSDGRAPRRHARTGAAFVLAVLAIAGCQSVPLDPGAAERRASEARVFEEQGVWLQAALKWDEAADKAGEPESYRYRLNAGLAYLRADDLGRARDRIDRSKAGLSGADLERAELASAELLLAAGDPEGCLQALENLDAQGSEAARWWALRSRALFMLGRDESAVGAAVTRERYLTDAAAIEAGRATLWRTLQQRASAGAPLQASPQADPVVRGWLDLARTQADANPYQAKARALDWRRRYPDHPGNIVLADMLDTYRGMLEYPQQVGLILPLSGRLAGAATAIRDGFMSGYLAAGDDVPRPVLRVYDSVALGPVPAYERAVADGADIIVGPLGKEEIAEVSAAELPRITHLALNRVDELTIAPAGMYQLSLSPEDEAAEAARRILAEEHLVGIVLRPDTAWGRRVAETFTLAFESGGGQVAASGVFDSRGQDYSVPIRRALLLDESEARHRSLERTLGLDLEFEPRRRADVTFIFVAANPAQGKLIRPQLRFHRATGLPVYATSAIHEPGSTDNDDLNGVMFDDIPWAVSPDEDARAVIGDIRSAWPATAKRGLRLYALGYDAYRLVPILHGGAEQSTEAYAGATGRLVIGAGGVIRRELPWARFEGGQIVALPPTPIAETAGEGEFAE